LLVGHGILRFFRLIWRANFEEIFWCVGFDGFLDLKFFFIESFSGAFKAFVEQTSFPENSGNYRKLYEKFSTNFPN
jgi:hypothetical protein